MLAKPYIQDAGHELATYEVAITDGKAYIAAHGGLSEGEAKVA